MFFFLGGRAHYCHSLFFKRTPDNPQWRWKKTPKKLNIGFLRHESNLEPYSLREDVFLGGFFMLKVTYRCRRRDVRVGVVTMSRPWGEIGQRNRLKVFVFFGGKKNPNALRALLFQPCVSYLWFAINRFFSTCFQDESVWGYTCG